MSEPTHRQAGEIFYPDAHRDAKRHYDQFIFLGTDECFEQIEAHLESEGYGFSAIEDATDRLFDY